MQISKLKSYNNVIFFKYSNFIAYSDTISFIFSLYVPTFEDLLEAADGFSVVEAVKLVLELTLSFGFFIFLTFYWADSPYPVSLSFSIL